MNLLIISHIFPNPYNKTNGIFVYHRVKVLKKLGMSFSVINPQPKCFPILNYINTYKKYCTIPEKYVFNEIEVISPKYVYFPVKFLRERIGILMFHSVLEYVDLLKKGNFDLIHAHGAIDGGIVAMKLSKKLHIPYVVTAHGSDINCTIGNKTKERYLFQVLSNASKVIFVSSALKEKSEELKEYSGKNAVVIPNGIDAKVFNLMDKSILREKLVIPIDSKIILFVGNLLEIKGVHLLPQIFKRIKDKIPNSFLYIVGDGPLKNKIAKDFLNFKISDSVIFVGRVPQRRAAEYMNAADVLVLPSLNEGFPNVINETLACGTPVVGSEVGGIPEAIGGKEYGTTFPVGNIEKAAEAIIEVLSRKWDRNMLTKKAGKFLWENIVNQEIDVYKEAIKS